MPLTVTPVAWDFSGQKWGRLFAHFSQVDGQGNNIAAPYGQVSVVDANFNNLNQLNPFPIVTVGSTLDIIANAATVSAGQAGNVALAGVANKTTYIRGFLVSSATVVTAVTGQISLSGLVNTLTFRYTMVTAGSGPLIQYFGEGGIPASAQNTAITLSLPAITGGSVADIVIWGYRV